MSCLRERAFKCPTPATREEIGQAYSAIQKLNAPQTAKIADFVSFIDRVHLLERCGSTTFTDAA